MREPGEFEMAVEFGNEALFNIMLVA